MTKHGHSCAVALGRQRTPTYTTWIGMRRRCSDAGTVGFPNYGGRGIKVCERWEDYTAFLEDMGERPSLAHSIERLDFNGDYEPSNCVWLATLAQSKNRRSCRQLTVRGVTKTQPQWADEVGIPRSTIRDRINRGWSAEEAIFTPKGGPSFRRKKTA